MKVSKEYLIKSLLLYNNGLLFWKDNNHFIEPINQNGYLVFKHNNRYYSYHRVIWTLFNGNIPDKMIVDHINNNRSDNRIENLRLATKTENSQNTLKTQKKKSSKYKGVYYSSAKDRWIAKTMFDGKPYHIGTYRTEEDAHRAYKEATQILFGDFANDGIK